MATEDVKIKIITDNRELRSIVAKKLFELGAEIQTESLSIGDYILSDEVAAERKTIDDFLQSIIDGRLFEQIANLTSAFKKSVLIIEGDEDIYNLRMIHPNAIRAALASVAVDFRLPIIFSQTQEETALFLYAIAKREQLDNKKSINLRGEKKPLNDRFLQEFLVSGLPGIGAGIAKNLLNHFKTVEKIFTAEEKELENVEKIGKVKSKKIREILTKEYKE